MLIDKYKDLNEDQRAIVESTSQFANDNIAPNSLKWDKECFFPKNIFKKAGELGLAGIYVSEEDGGLGLSRLDASLIFEELLSKVLFFDFFNNFGAIKVFSIFLELHI